MFDGRLWAVGCLLVRLCGSRHRFISSPEYICRPCLFVVTIVGGVGSEGSVIGGNPK
jgi:hypothetical protein